MDLLCPRQKNKSLSKISIAKCTYLNICYYMVMHHWLCHPITINLVLIIICANDELRLLSISHVLCALIFISNLQHTKLIVNIVKIYYLACVCVWQQCIKYICVKTLIQLLSSYFFVFEKIFCLFYIYLAIIAIGVRNLQIKFIWL